MSWTPFSASQTTPKQLRPFDIRRDINAVADLIESCFSHTLDADGRRYIRRMREAAQQKGFNRWYRKSARSKSFSLSGFVWEEGGQVVGNISLVPFSYKRQRIYLLANVAVKPEFRRQGIAQALTTAALEKSYQHRVRAVWLQVRHDNQQAMDLYLKRGFLPQATRTTWKGEPEKLVGDPSDKYRVKSRQISHWAQHQKLLHETYPEKLRWHFHNDLQVIIPGWLGIITNLIEGHHAHHWSVNLNNRTLGFLSWQRTYRSSDRLWLAAQPEDDNEVLKAVIPIFQNNPGMQRSLILDYPADRAVETLTKLGFKPKSTLIWMEVKRE